MDEPDARRSAESLFASHPRAFGDNHYVYPVVSRRAGGVSIGVNLTLDRICNFGCVYCQVDRSEPHRAEPVDIDRLTHELDATVRLVLSGRIYDDARFARTPKPLRRLNDLALSGDAEPTMSPRFNEAVDACAEIRRRHRLEDVRLVLITNASMLHRESIGRGLATLAENHGEIWAKLDAGTEAYYRRVSRSSVPWQRILTNLRDAAVARPIVIQSLWTRIQGEPVPESELAAYCDRLVEILAAGGRIQLVQIHTVARPPAESWVEPLGDAELDAIARLVGRRTGLPCRT